MNSLQLGEANSILKVKVVTTASEARAERFNRTTTVVIDVLRATSTIAAALCEGAAACVIPVETEPEARWLCAEGDVLGGERFCRKIDGFHLGNSPSEYDKNAVRGKRVILTTTNGTRAIQKAAFAEHVVTGSFNNAEACAAAAVKLGCDIVLLCAGRQDEFALEDGLCAGLLLARISALSDNPPEADELGTILLSYYQTHAGEIPELIARSPGGKRLASIGMGADIADASDLNRYKGVPYLSGGILTLLK
jgi:2-phosphosulfolactate phosphatase